MRTASRCAAFTVIGALGFLVQSGTLAALLALAGLHYLLAASMAVEVAVLHNFVWHERWTWRDRPASGWRGRLRRLGSFHVTNGLISMLGNLAVAWLLVELAGLPVIWSSAIAMIATGAVNFVASDRLVFATPRWLTARVPARLLRGLVMAAIVLWPAGAAEAADLKPETVEAWNRYVRATEARIAREEAAPYHLLARHDAALLLARLRAGEVLVEKLETHDGSGGAIDVPGVAYVEFLVPGFIV